MSTTQSDYITVKQGSPHPRVGAVEDYKEGGRPPKEHEKEGEQAMTEKNARNRGFTLAEMIVTLAVMGMVLALVAGFSATASKATKQRTAEADVIGEIESLDELITKCFYTFDSTDYKFLEVENRTQEYKYDFFNGTVINVSPSEFTIQNKRFNEMIAGGIVPTNYQLVYNVDRDSLEKVITAVYSAKGERKSDTYIYSCTLKAYVMPWAFADLNTAVFRRRYYGTTRRESDNRR